MTNRVFRRRGAAVPRARAWRRFLLVAALLGSPAGCGQRQSHLILHCGAGIRPAASELAREFSRRRGVKIECNYAGSETLLASIKLSRSGDIYMPGDAHYLDQAAAEDLIASRKQACYFIPVILVRKGNPKGIRGLTDLARRDVKVGLGDPKACAIGRKASKVFAKNKIAEEKVNVVFRSLTVNELGDKIKLGHLDAVIVWDAVAAYYADHADVVPIPVEQNVISTVQVGVLRCSTHPKLAAEFADFVASGEGQEILRKHHYATSLPNQASGR